MATQQKNRDDFSSSTKTALAKRAANICSNPICNCLTQAPTKKSVDKSVNIGVAAHICAAAPGGARYDENQTPEQRASIENAIWLCVHCSTLIDKNQGMDYGVNLLKEWKSNHEKEMARLQTLKTSPLALILKNTDEALLAQEIIHYLDDKGCFYISDAFERHDYVISSLSETRKYLTLTLNKLNSDSFLYKHTKLLKDECQNYMNKTSNQKNLRPSHLDVTRDNIGSIIEAICDRYNIKPTSNLITIMPSTSK